MTKKYEYLLVQTVESSRGVLDSKNPERERVREREGVCRASAECRKLQGARGTKWKPQYRWLLAGARRSPARLAVAEPKGASPRRVAASQCWLWCSSSRLQLLWRCILIYPRACSRLCLTSVLRPSILSTGETDSPISLSPPAQALARAFAPPLPRQSPCAPIPLSAYPPQESLECDFPSRMECPWNGEWIIR